MAVSNHGGRQVGAAIAALYALPEVDDAIGDDLPVMMDSTRGADRYTKSFAICRLEIDLTLALCGHAFVRTVDRRVLRAQR